MIIWNRQDGRVRPQSHIVSGFFARLAKSLITPSIGKWRFVETDRRATMSATVRTGTMGATARVPSVSATEVI